MDVNGTRLHVLLGRRDWLGPDEGEPSDPRLEWDAASHSLTLRRRLFRFPARGSAHRLTPADRRGAASDRYGNWYWIDRTRTRIDVQAAGRASVTPYWHTDEPEACPPDGGTFRSAELEPASYGRLAGLTVTAHNYLVVGVPELPGLLVFDLHGGGPPVVIPWPDGEEALSPVDMAAAPDGGVVILDVPDGAEPRYWQLDRYLRVRDLGGVQRPRPPVPDFTDAHPDDDADVHPDDDTDAPPDGPADADIASGDHDPPTARAHPPGSDGGSSPILPGMAARLGSRRPVSIEALPDGTVLVLEAQGEDGDLEVLRYRGEERLPFPLPLAELAELFDTVGEERPGGDVLVGHDLVFVPSDPGSPELRGTLHLVDDRGDQVFAFEVADGGERVTARTSYHPLRLFAGKALARHGGTVFYDLGDRWLPVPERTRPRHDERGTIETVPLDGDEPGCVWHRLFLDGCLPPGTEVVVEARAADDPEQLARTDWTPQPRPYLRGSGAEIPYHWFPDRSTDVEGAGTWELLFQQVRGRHAQVRLGLRGDGRRTPRLWCLRLHYPRYSYVDAYLPDVYREDADSASFLIRYLANVEGILTEVEGRIAAAQVLFDPGAAPADGLGWLGEWLGAVLDPDWDEDRRRLFLRHAAELFSRRGTPRGLQEAVRLAIDPCPDASIFGGDDDGHPFGVRLVERYRTRRAPGVVFGDPSELVGPRIVIRGPRWRLEEGGAGLNERWRDHLESEDVTTATTSAFPPLLPADGQERRIWRRFVRGHLDVPYAEVVEGDVDAYRGFLRERYRRTRDLADAWELPGSEVPGSFDEVVLPDALPTDGTPLRDWIQFVSIVLPVRRRAHRFSVLVPVRPHETDAERRQRLGRVERVVAMERPGHTSVEVRPYLAAFRVGEARLGHDTVVGESSRYVAVVLDRVRLATGFLTGRQPWDVADRTVVGRDRIPDSPASAATDEWTGGR